MESATKSPWFCPLVSPVRSSQEWILRQHELDASSFTGRIHSLQEMAATLPASERESRFLDFSSKALGFWLQELTCIIPRCSRAWELVSTMKRVIKLGGFRCSERRWPFVETYALFFRGRNKSEHPKRFAD